MTKRNQIVCLLIVPDYRPGDKPPEGYLEWHAWADVQRKAGIKQYACSCGKWITPQQEEDHRHPSQVSRLG